MNWPFKKPHSGARLLKELELLLLLLLLQNKISVRCQRLSLVRLAKHTAPTFLALARLLQPCTLSLKPSISSTMPANLLQQP